MFPPAERQHWLFFPPQSETNSSQLSLNPGSPNSFTQEILNGTLLALSSSQILRDTEREGRGMGKCSKNKIAYFQRGHREGQVFTCAHVDDAAVNPLKASFKTIAKTQPSQAKQFPITGFRGPKRCSTWVTGQAEALTSSFLSFAKLQTQLSTPVTPFS